jgi:hypothetical protein
MSLCDMHVNALRCEGLVTRNLTHSARATRGILTWLSCRWVPHTRQGCDDCDDEQQLNMNHGGLSGYYCCVATCAVYMWLCRLSPARIPESLPPGRSGLCTSAQEIPSFTSVATLILLFLSAVLVQRTRPCHLAAYRGLMVPK